MSRLLFVLGRTPELGLLELTSFFPQARLISPHIALVSEDLEYVRSTFRLLGGSVKLAQCICESKSISPELVSSFFTGQMHKVIFGVSSYDEAVPVTTAFLHDVKEILVSRGISSRFVMPHEGKELSSVVVEGQQITEIIIAAKGNGYVIGKTYQVQDFEDWNKRDYGRPYADPRAGMLPPKVARMIVNIAVSGLRRTNNDEQITLLDPFCGMGTILSEALLMGWNVIGSDQSESVIVKAKRNNEWLASHYKYTRPPARQIDVSLVKFYAADATHISEHVAKESVDAIVTEPFMGPAYGGNDQLPMTNNQIKDIKNTIKGLEKLYIGCLRDWYNVLKPDGKVVIALPLYVAGGREFFVKKVIDMCENLGYTVEQGPIEYSRPQAVVKRKFFVFEKR